MQIWGKFPTLRLRRTASTLGFNDAEYKGVNVERKELLDKLLQDYKAQPVGNGYIDIIVMRDNYNSLAEKLLSSGFEISAISWWEYLDDVNKPNTYGMGGPISKYYSGWFSETCTDLDELSNLNDPNKKLEKLIKTIENKVLGKYGKTIVSYKNSPSLTPAFWLEVDKEWTNVQQKET